MVFLIKGVNDLCSLLCFIVQCNIFIFLLIGMNWALYLVPISIIFASRLTQKVKDLTCNSLIFIEIFTRFDRKHKYG